MAVSLCFTVFSRGLRAQAAQGRLAYRRAVRRRRLSVPRAIRGFVEPSPLVARESGSQSVDVPLRASLRAGLPVGRGVIAKAYAVSRVRRSASRRRRWRRRCPPGAAPRQPGFEGGEVGAGGRRVARRGPPSSPVARGRRQPHRAPSTRPLPPDARRSRHREGASRRCRCRRSRAHGIPRGMATRAVRTRGA